MKFPEVMTVLIRDSCLTRKRQFLLLLCEKHASFVWCSENEDTLNKCVDVRFCEHERLSIRRSNCGSVTAHRNGLSIRIRATNSIFIASDDSFRACLNLWWRGNPCSTFIYVAVKLIDLRPSILKIAVVSNKKNGSYWLCFASPFLIVLVRVNACGDELR